MRHGDHGQATLEHIGLVGSIAVLLMAVAATFGPLGTHAAGSQLASSIGQRIADAVAHGGSAEPLGKARVHGSHLTGGTVGTGSHAPRLTDLQMHEIGPQLAWRTWSSDWSHTSLPAGATTSRDFQVPGAAGTVEGALCMLCLGTSALAQYALGGAVHGTGQGVSTTDLLGVDALVRAHLALLHETVSATEVMQGFGVQVSTRVSAAGTAGVDGSLAAQLELGRLHQALVLEAGAVAGLSGHVEQRASARFAGIAVQATAGADGWLGAGLTGRIHVGHEGPGKFSWDIGGGAGLGLGGGAHLAGALDVSGAMRRHPHLMAGVLANSLLGMPAGSAAPALVRIATTGTTRPAHRPPRNKGRRP